MSNWMNRINLKDLNDSYVEGETSSAAVGKEVAKRLRKLSECMRADEDEKDKLEDIICEFESIDDTASLREQQDEFNGILNELYDWGDTWVKTPLGEMERRLCWVGFAF